MINRLAATLVLGGVGAFAAGCSSSGGGALPPGTAAQGSPSWAQPLHNIKIREFSDLPQYSGYYGPSAVAAASGTLWVTDDIDQDYGEDVVVQIATSGKALNAFYYPGVSTEGASFQDITAGPDGALWITDIYNEQIVRMTTHGAFTNFPLKNYTAPLSIANGPDRALWFTAESSGSYAIGRITTSGRITLYAVPAQALDIASGPDGALWFTEPSSDRVGRISTRGKITEYSKGITAGSQPYSIAAGADGALWFTERAGGRIGRITTGGRVTEYSRGITPTEEPFDLAGGPDGAIWFTEYETSGSYQVTASKIGRITTRGRIQEYSNLDPKAGPTEITEGPDSRMWFVESFVDKTGRATP
jgi:virginiamycin B lyase